MKRNYAFLGTNFFWYCTIQNIVSSFLKQRNHHYNFPASNRPTRASCLHSAGSSQRRDQNEDISSGLVLSFVLFPPNPFWFLRFLVLFQGVAFCFFLSSFFFFFSFQMSSCSPLILASKKFRLWASNHLKCLHWSCWKPLLSFPQNQCYFKKRNGNLFYM